MIGTTQLLNSGIVASDMLGLDAATAFTSHDQVAASGQPNGTYYFNDGTRTRQYYFDVDGSESNSEGGWARWDSSWADWYYGRECAIADLSSDGLIDNQAGASYVGSTQHSGCGVWSNDLFKCQYITVSDINMDGTSYASYPPYVYLVNAASDAFPTVNNGPGGNTYYPGNAPYGAHTLELYIIKRDPYYAAAPSPTTATTHNYQSGNASWAFVAGAKYNLGTKADRKLWNGSSDYSGTYADGFQPAKRGRYKVWFKF